jgi:hypothetical protein
MAPVIRALEPGDWAEWLRMRYALWPHHSPAEHEAEMATWQARPDAAAIVAVRATRGLCGFAEVATRPYASGCESRLSDALLDNVVSHRAHQQLGFTEVERAVHYRGPLGARCR